MLTPCPRCSAPLTGGPTCPGCALPLTGPAAAALWQVDQRIAGLDGRIAGLRTERQALWAEHVRLVVAISETAPAVASAHREDNGFPPPVPAPPLAPAWAFSALAPAPRRAPAPTAPVAARPEWTPRRVQNLLLWLGALLVVLSAAIFTLVSWQHLGAEVRGCILIAVTAGAGFGARVLVRRGLTATAEAVAGVAVGLGLFDALAFRSLVLPDSAPRAYWSIAVIVLAMAAAAFGRAAGVRVPVFAAAILVLLPLMILATGDLTSAQRSALVSLDALAAAVGLAALQLRGATGRTGTDLRACWMAAGGVTWTVGFITGAWPVVAGPVDAAVPLLVTSLAILAAAAGLAAWTAADHLPLRTGSSAASALAVICALAVPSEAVLISSWWPVVLTSAALAVTLGASLLPDAWRTGPLLAGASVAAAATLVELPSVASTLLGQLGWVAQPWDTAAALTPSRLVSEQAGAGAGTVLTLAVAALVAAAVAPFLSRRAAGHILAGSLALTAGVIAVPQLGGAYATGLGITLVLTCSTAAATALSADRNALAGTAGTGFALSLATLTACWSLALPAATVVVGATMAAAFGVLASAQVPYREYWAGGAVLSAGLAAPAVAHVAGAPDPALGLAVALVAFAAAAALLVRPGATSSITPVVEGCAAVLALAGLVLSTASASWASWTLLAVAGSAAAVASRPGRRRIAPAAAGLAIASMTWLPFAQGATAAVATATCIAAVAATLALAGWLASTTQDADLRAVAALLAMGSAAPALAAMGEASTRSGWLAPTLGALALLYGTVAAASDNRMHAAEVGLAWRAAAAGTTTACLLGAAAAGCADNGVTAARTGLVVALVAALLALAATRLSTRRPDAAVVEAVCALAALMALRACAGQPVEAGWVLAIAGVTVLAAATSPGRRAWWPAGAVLIAAATWTWLAVAGVTSPEPYVDPIAAVALVVGYTKRRTQPSTASLTAYGPGLALLLLPSLAYALAGANLDRPLLLAGLATAVVIVGAQHRLRAPLLFGSATLLLTGLRLLAPYEPLIPRWIEIGTAGALLLMLGATYEQRRRDLGLLRSRYEALL